MPGHVRRLTATEPMTQHLNRVKPRALRRRASFFVSRKDETGGRPIISLESPQPVGLLPEIAVGVRGYLDKSKERC